MFGPPGHAYVYRSYGIHWCLNLVCDGRGSGECRAHAGARADRTGSSRCAAPRGRTIRACSAPGPGRLCQALGVTREHDGLPLDAPPFELLAPRRAVEVVARPRIGISRAAELPWRYGARGLALPQPAVRAARDELDRHARRGGEPRLGSCARTMPGVALDRADTWPAELSARSFSRACSSVEPDELRDRAVRRLRDDQLHGRRRRPSVPPLGILLEHDAGPLAAASAGR